MRAECLPSSSDSKYVIDVLKANNYPKDFLQNCLKPVHQSRKTDNDSSMMDFAVVPYIHGLTEPIKRIFCSYHVKVAQKSFFILNHIFAKPKKPKPFPVAKEQRSDAIYSILCNDCNQEYVGQTKRQFGTRLKSTKKQAPFQKG